VTVALIAIKERERCKTRLRASVDDTARLELVRSMLAAVLAAATSAQTVHQTIVVSPERDLIPATIPVLADTGQSLNTALAQAQRMLRNFGCHEVLVLPADLPQITAAEIDTLVRAGRESGFSIAPDANGTGTNALALVSAQPFRFQFGPDSQRLHLQEAQRMGLSPLVIRLPGLAFDVDTPADLERLEEQQWRTRLRA
jgi:2-phospho-L-lactate guanylyltransferase